MKITITRHHDKAEVRQTGNIIDLVATGVNMEINPDASPSFIYYSGISVSLPENTIGIIVPVEDLSSKSFVMASAGRVITGTTEEIVCKFKLNTTSVPNLYNAGDVFAKIIILDTPEITESSTIDNIVEKPTEEKSEKAEA